MQKQAAFEKYENRVQELMHDEKQQERLEEAKAAKEKELERHTVRTRTTYGTYSYDVRYVLELHTYTLTQLIRKYE